MEPMHKEKTENIPLTQVLKDSGGPPWWLNNWNRKLEILLIKKILVMLFGTEGRVCKLSLTRYNLISLIWRSTAAETFTRR